MERDAVDLAGDQARQAAGRGGWDELRVIDREAGGLEHLAAHAPVEAADAAAGGAEPPALEVGRGLDVGRHHVGLRHPGRQTPELLHLHAAADGDVADAHDRRALCGGRARGRRLAALELQDGGVDAALGEEAELLRHVGRGVHHVGRCHRDADLDRPHRGAGWRGLRCGGACVRQHEQARDERQQVDQSIPIRHGTLLSLTFNEGSHLLSHRALARVARNRRSSTTTV